MRNPFAIRVEDGYRWQTFGYGRDTSYGVWIKLGPVSFSRTANGWADLCILGGRGWHLWGDTL
jgi:hypothetical protein